MTIQEVGSGDTRQKPIKLGGALITLVEPHRGHEVENNRWYERDHFYAGCMIGAWTIGGTRYVATRAHKDVRFPADSPVASPVDQGSYVAIYWVLAGKFGEWIQWGTDQVNWLHANDRMFNERDHIHTALYEYAGEANAPGSHMPVELALDRHYEGLVVFIGEMADGVDATKVTAWLQDMPSTADVALVGTPLPLRSDRPADVPDTQADNRVLILGFVEHDPLATWDARFTGIGSDFAAAGLGEIVFASPFLATIPGTDTYTDQLW